MNRVFQIPFLRLILITAFGLQASYLTRYAYIGFEIAPDCPVLGLAPESECCHSSDDIPPRLGDPDTQIQCSQVGSSEWIDQSPAAPTSHKPRKRSQDCPTCQIFAVVGQFVSLPPPPANIFHLPISTVTYHHAEPRCLAWISPTGARAPPIVLS